jgi:hypothetical protein
MVEYLVIVVRVEVSNHKDALYVSWVLPCRLFDGFRNVLDAVKLGIGSLVVEMGIDDQEPVGFT